MCVCIYIWDIPVRHWISLTLTQRHYYGGKRGVSYKQVGDSCHSVKEGNELSNATN